MKKFALAAIFSLLTTSAFAQATMDNKADAMNNKADAIRAAGENRTNAIDDASK